MIPGPFGAKSPVPRRKRGTMKLCKACGKPVVGMFCQTPKCDGKAPKKPASGFKTFDEWMAAVNKALESLVGQTSDDLPDFNYYDAYWKANRDPVKTAKAAIKAAGGF